MGRSSKIAGHTCLFLFWSLIDIDDTKQLVEIQDVPMVV
jgi:hypothetical protein